MTSQSLNRACGVDVRGVIRATVEQLRSTGDTGMVQNLLDADAAVAELVERGRVLSMARKAFLCGKAEYSADWINFNATLAAVEGKA